MEQISTGTWIALILPIMLLQLGLIIFALVDLVTRRSVRYLSRWVWALLIIFIGFLGPVLYLVIGREET